VVAGPAHAREQDLLDRGRRVVAGHQEPAPHGRPDAPEGPVLDGPHRVLVLVSTNAVMVVVAMSLVMFTHDLYPWYAQGHTLAQQDADQQVAGSILWVCGEITFLPSILFTVVAWLRQRAPEAAPTLVPASTVQARPHG